MRSELFISMLSAVYSAPNVSEIEATLLEESMKKFLIGLGITVAVLVILGIVFRGPLMMMAGMAFMQPDHSFANDKTAPAPDCVTAQSHDCLPYSSIQTSFAQSRNLLPCHKFSSIIILHPSPWPSFHQSSAPH